jgi:hypothetical protein
VIEPHEDDGRHIAIDKTPEGYPHLMLICPKRLTASEMKNIREAMVSGMNERKPMIFESGLAVFQLADGKWQPLKHPDSVPTSHE